MNDKGDIILATLWIDQTNNTLLKIESTTKTNGTFTIVLNYGNNKFPLPEKIEFTFNTARLRLSHNPMEEENNNNQDKKTASTTGKVYVNYSNYAINKGVPDWFLIIKLSLPRNNFVHSYY